MAAEGGGVARQAELRHAEGNACLRKDRLGAAIDCYTEAIALYLGVAVYWVNRGLCHFRRKDWTKVEEDEEGSRARRRPRPIVKGHYLLGCALLEKEECALAVKEFEKALNLLKSSNSTNKTAEDIWQVLAKAKFLHWKKHSTERVSRFKV